MLLTDVVLFVNAGRRIGIVKDESGRDRALSHLRDTPEAEGRAASMAKCYAIRPGLYKEFTS